MKPDAVKRAIDQLSELASRLPWWGALLAAIAVYTLLHPIAALQMPTPTGLVNLVTTALGQLVVFVARIGQYLLPLAFLVAAAISGFNRWKRRELRESVAQDTSGSILRALPWADFDLLVSDAFRCLGYKLPAPHRDRQAGDRMLELTRDGRHFLVDCTDWRSSKAGATAIRRLHQLMKGAGTTGGFAVTSGQFTPEAKHFAAEGGIVLIDGRQLKELVRAEPPPIKGNPRQVLAMLRPGIARCWSLIASVCRASKGGPHAREPTIGTVADSMPEAGIHPVRDTFGSEATGADNAEVVAGRELSALIRAERRILGDVALSVPPMQKRRDNPPRPRWRLPSTGTRKIADSLGVLIGIGALWGIYEWFAQLPDAPADTPWALLGADSSSEVLRERLQGLGRTRPAAQTLDGGRPLGQYQFGPPTEFLIAAEPEMQAPAEPLEVYHSLRELEMAFKAKYVPPPECYAYESSNLLVKCGNHRIRARHTFIASGGKVTPTLLGSWEEPRPVLSDIRPEDWHRTDAGGWHQESTQDWEQDWHENGDQESRRPWDQWYAPEPNPTVANTFEPVPTRRQVEFAQDTQWDLQRRHRQDPGLDWRQDAAQQPAPEPEQDWRREWLQEPAWGSDGEWRREWAPEPTQKPSDDWRSDWRQTDTEDRRHDWRSQPLPVERRHWVDDF